MVTFRGTTLTGCLFNLCPSPLLSPHTLTPPPSDIMANKGNAIPLPEEDFFVLGTILGAVMDNRRGITWRDIVKVSRQSIATL